MLSRPLQHPYRELESYLPPLIFLVKIFTDKIKSNPRISFWSNSRMTRYRGELQEILEDALKITRVAHNNVSIPVAQGDEQNRKELSPY